MAYAVREPNNKFIQSRLGYNKRNEKGAPGNQEHPMYFCLMIISPSHAPL